MRMRQYRFSTEERAYREGYFQCGDDIMNWINAQDSSEMTVKEFRSLLWTKILDCRPDYRNYSYSDTRRNPNKEEDTL